MRRLGRSRRLESPVPPAPAFTVIPIAGHAALPNGGDTLLIEPLQEPGHRQSVPTITALGLDGTERARFVVGAPRSTGGFGSAAEVHATAAPGRVVVRYPAGPTEVIGRLRRRPHRVAVLDIPTGTIVPLRVGADADSLRFDPCHAIDTPAAATVASLWRPRAAAVDSDPARTDHPDLAEVWLVDLHTLAVRHIDDATFDSRLFGLAVSAAGRSIAVGTAAGIRIGSVSPSAPIAAVATHGPVTHLTFAPDGSTLAYTVANPSAGTMECWLLAQDGSRPRLLAEVTGRHANRSPLFVSSQVVAFSVGDAVALCDTYSGDVSIHRIGPEACATTASPGGEASLCRARIHGDRHERGAFAFGSVSDVWYRLEVASGTLQRLGVDTVTWPHHPPACAPWQLFLEDSGDELPSAFVAIELATGRERRFLPGNATQLFGQVEVIGETPGAASAFFAVEIGEESTVWRTDFVTGAASLVARDYGDAPWGMFSPDGRFLALQAFDETSDTPPNRAPLAVFSTTGEEIIRIDGGALLGWAPASR